MGPFDRFRHPTEAGNVKVDDVTTTAADLAATVLTEPHVPVMAMVTFMVIIASLRILLHQSRLRALEGTHKLDLSNLNNAVMCKEVFLAYLNAALLEPVLAIGGMEEVKGNELIINVFTLGSICWWIWMITDAFDYFDVAQSFKYQAELQPEADANPETYFWLQMKPKEKDKEDERKALVGSFQRDVALWFSLASIGAAWLPESSVSHRDVMHAYAICFFWTVLHHSCRQATTWSAGYASTFLFPSAALMPMEYCMPLMDTFDFVEDLEGVATYRDFIKERTGVSLTIVS